MYNTMARSKELLKMEIDKLNAKGDISPTELNNLCLAYKTLREISTIEAMDGEYGDASYARGGGRGGGSSRGSYGGSYRSNSYGGSYGYEGDESYRRGRGSDGRYVSREGSYEGGYSGHSVKDRMIASLEREMDMAQSEYDRNKIQEEIRHLREQKD